MKFFKTMAFSFFVALVVSFASANAATGIANCLHAGTVGSAGQECTACRKDLWGGAYISCTNSDSRNTRQDCPYSPTSGPCYFGQQRSYLSIDQCALACSQEPDNQCRFFVVHNLNNGAGICNLHLVTSCPYAGSGTSSGVYSIPLSCADRTVCNPLTQFTTRFFGFGVDTQCATATVCRSNEYQWRALAVSVDRGCAALTVCSGTQFESKAPTAISNRECKTARVCAPTEYETLALSASVDRLCAPLSPACNGVTTFQFVAPTASSNRVCAYARNCTADAEYETRSLTASADRVCAALSLPCNAITVFQRTAPTATSDRVCAFARNCTVAEYESQLLTVLADRQCAMLSAPCNYAVAFQSVAPTITSDRRCEYAINCTAAEYESRPLSLTTDRQCATLLDCDGITSFQTQPPTLTSNRVCEATRKCTVAQFETAAPTLVTDRNCAALTVCDVNAFESMAPSRTSNRVCLPLTICANVSALAWEEFPPTPTSDRVCATRVRFCAVFAPENEQSCRTCNQGYALADNATVCRGCLPGSFCPDGVDSLPCPRGQMQPGTFAVTCQSCLPGLYQSEPGQIRCLPCIGPAFSGAEAIACVNISRGYYGVLPAYSNVSAVGYGEQLPCERGFACRAALAVPCAAGFFQPDAAQSDCLPCPRGSFSALVSRSTLCDLIAPGWLGTGGDNSGAAQTGQLLCATGSFCTGGLTRLCAAGSAQPLQGQSACVSCNQTHFSANEGSDVCLACDLTCPVGLNLTSLAEPRLCNSTTGVAVCFDVTAPAMTLRGAASLVLEAGQLWTDVGATAVDTWDGGCAVQRVGPSVGRVLGVFNISYSSRDKAGNTATLVRTVTVSDTLAPVMTLRGSPIVQRRQSPRSYVDMGVSAADAFEGNLTMMVVVSGTSFDPTRVGNFTILYNCADRSGNRAAPLTRLVQVLNATIEVNAFEAARVAFEQYLALYPTQQRNTTVRDAGRILSASAYRVAGGQLLDSSLAVSAAVQDYDTAQSSSEQSASLTGMIVGIALGVFVVGVFVIAAVVVRHRRRQIKDGRAMTIPVKPATPTFHTNMMTLSPPSDMSATGPNGGWTADMPSSRASADYDQFFPDDNNYASAGVDAKRQVDGGGYVDTSSTGRSQNVAYAASADPPTVNACNIGLAAPAGVYNVVPHFSTSVAAEPNRYDRIDSAAHAPPIGTYLIPVPVAAGGSTATAPAASAYLVPGKLAHNIYEGDADISSTPANIYQVPFEEDYAHIATEDRALPEYQSISGAVESTLVAVQRLEREWHPIPGFSRADAEGLLLTLPVGHFFVRPSTQANCLALSVRCGPATKAPVWNGLINLSLDSKVTLQDAPSVSAATLAELVAVLIDAPEIMAKLKVPPLVLPVSSGANYYTTSAV